MNGTYTFKADWGSNGVNIDLKWMIAQFDFGIGYKQVTSTTNFDPLLVTSMPSMSVYDYELTGNFAVHRVGTSTPIGNGFYSAKYSEALDAAGSTITTISPGPFGGTLSVAFDGGRAFNDVNNKLVAETIQVGDTIVATAYDDVVRGNDIGTRFRLGAGNDRVEARGGINNVDGGTGFDVAIYAGSRDDYVTAKTDAGFTVIGNGSFDTLISIERIEFKDGVIVFAADGNMGQAYRLYNAAFERSPDVEGLAYWTGRLNDGDTSLNAIADSFINSPEFVTKFGTVETVSNARFVELLYLHTLGRGYDQQGFDYWVDRLDAAATNRGDLLAFFSESDENQTKAAETISDGIWLPY